MWKIKVHVVNSVNYKGISLKVSKEIENSMLPPNCHKYKYLLTTSLSIISSTIPFINTGTI